MYKLLVWNKNTWNKTTVYKLFVIDDNSRYHNCVSKSL